MTFDTPKPDSRPIYLALFFNKTFGVSYNSLFTLEEFAAMRDAKLMNLSWCMLIEIESGYIAQRWTPSELDQLRLEAARAAIDKAREGA